MTATSAAPTAPTIATADPNRTDQTHLAEAQAITAPAERGQVLLLAGSLSLDQGADQIASATLHATAEGVVEASINGTPVDDAVLNPGWTAYEWRLQVIETDVTELVRAAGEDVELGLRLGNGWWRGDMGFQDPGVAYGQQISVIAALEISYRDGSSQRLTTGPDWTAQTTDTTQNSLYDGQTIDARLRSEPQRLEVEVVEFDRSRLAPRLAPLIRRQEVLAPVEVITSPSGKTLIDFGQNLVGWLRVTVRGEAGDEIVLRHAEVLEHGELGTRPLRRAQATDRFICSGGDDVFEPTMTFHGFRYVEVTGWPGTLDLAAATEAIEAVVVHSDLERTGWFECSEPLVNQLVSNSLWSQRGNFLSVPTDCPQRDERLGWTGDISAYAATATGQFDVSDFLHSWLVDLELETRHGGWVPFVVPDLLKLIAAEGMGDWHGATAIWGDAAAWVPQALWQAYGDLDRLRAHYPGMVAHLESVEPRLSPTDLWDTGHQFADWLDPDAPPDNAAAAKADKGVVSTASFYRSVVFTAEVAGLLGLEHDQRRWQALADRLRTAFVAHYVSDDGRVRSDCATVYALALHFGLIPEELVEAAVDRLAEVVREAGYKVSTGFAGTPYVTWALSEHGRTDEAYRLLLEQGCPSWLYPVTMGATTIWERWDSMLPNGEINPGEMTSFNHYALGAVCDWLYQVVGGIRPAAPGFSSVLIAPVPGPGIDWVNAARQTPHGRVECAWRRDGDQVRVEVEVPEGVSAELRHRDGTTTPLAPGRSEHLLN